MYGLFVRAVLSNVYPIFASPEATIPFGPRGFLRYTAKATTGAISNGASSGKEPFQFFELSVQLLASGKLIVTCSDRGCNFHSLSLDSVVLSTATSRRPVFVSLAPTSQIARFGDDDDEDERDPRAEEVHCQKLLKTRIVCISPTK